MGTDTATDQHELQQLRQRIVDLEQQLAQCVESKEALHHQLERLELVLRGTEDGFWDFDFSANSAYFSPSWKRMFGYGADEEPGGLDQWRERIHPDDRERIIGALDAYLANEVSRYHTEYRLRRRDGEYIWVMARGAAVRGPDGRATRLTGTHTDISERKQKEREHHEEAERMRLILREAPIILFSVDRDGTITFADGKFLRQLGVNPSVLIGKSIFKAYAHATKTLDSINRALQGEQVNWIESLTVHISDNRAIPLRDENGDVYGVLSIAFDLTEQRRAIAQMRASEQRLRALLDYMPIALFMLDMEGMITFIDGRVMAGIDTSALVGQHVSVLPHHNAGAGEHIRAVLAGEERNWYSNTDTHTFDIRAVPLRDEAGKIIGLLGIAADSTERMQVEAERSRIQETIIKAQEAALAELSTPLIPISDHVLVMPLVGNLDPRRAQQVLDTLLNGIAQNHAHVVILDITGVPIVDTQVANTLLQAAQAVQLLGAQVVLTGIRPEVAQTLVGLGLDLGRVVTRSSLQSGIAYAVGGQGQLGQAVMRTSRALVR